VLFETLHHTAVTRAAGRVAAAAAAAGFVTAGTPPSG
jgi:hypothetical protein